MSRTPRAQSSYQAVLALAKLAGVLRKAGDRFFRAYGLTQSQFNTLVVLRAASPQGCTQTEICRRLLVKPANMTGLMRRLERQGLLRREPDPGDERAWRVRISGKGRKLLRQVEPVYYRRVERIMGIHSERDLEKFRRQLERTREAVTQQAN